MLNNIIQNQFFRKYAIFILIFSALFFSTYHLTESPRIWYDEGFYTQLALNVSEGDGFTIQVAPESFVSGSGITAGFPIIAPVALFYKLFNPGVLSGRAAMVLFLLLFITFSYFLVRRLFDYKMALLSGALIVTFPVLYGNGKSVIGEVPGLLFVVLALIVLLSLERNYWRGLWRFALLGLFVSLAIVTKPIYILFLPAVFIGLLLKGRTFFLSFNGILVGILCFSIPFLIWITTQFGLSDSFNDILAFYINPYEIVNIWETIAENTLRFVTEPSPLYLFIFLVIWLTSLIVRKKDSISVVEVIAAVFTFLVIVFYTRTPGWYRYFFPAQIIVLLFLPFALRTVFEWAHNYVSILNKKTVNNTFVFVIMALSFFQLLQLSFYSYVASYYGATKTQELVLYFKNFDHDTSFFLYDAPAVAILLPTRNYYQYAAPHPNQIFGMESLNVLEQEIPDILIIPSDSYFKDKKDKIFFPNYSIKKIIKGYTILGHI